MTVSETQVELCPVEHRIDPERKRRVRPGNVICGGCQARLERSLRELPDLWDELGESLPGVQRAGGAGPVSGTAETRLPFSPPISAHLHTMKLTVMSWCVLVSDKRLTHGEHHPLPPSYELGDTCRWLLIHTDWCAGQGFARDMVHEIRHLAGRARGLMDPQRQMNIHLGECVEEDCPGELYGTLREDDPTPWLILCDAWQYSEDPDAADRHEWPITAWLSLGRQIMQRKAAS